MKALGLAFMCARNPKEKDSEKQLIEVFSKNPAGTPRENNPENLNNIDSDDKTMSARISQDIGFHF